MAERELGTRGAKLVREAPQYPEGKAIRLEVSDASDLPLVKSLARIKIQS